MGITVVSSVGRQWFGVDGWLEEEDGELTLLKDGSVVARFQRPVWAAFWTDEVELKE